MQLNATSALAAEMNLVPSTGWWNMNVNIVAEGCVGHRAPAALPRQARRAPAPASGEGEKSGCSVPHLVEHRQREKVCLIAAKKWGFNVLDCNI